MENKDNYTQKEIENIVKAVREYDLYNEHYIHIIITTCTWDAENKNRIEFRSIAKTKFKNSLENCKTQMPTSLINKLGIVDIEINPKNDKIEFKDIK